MNQASLKLILVILFVFGTIGLSIYSLSGSDRAHSNSEITDIVEEYILDNPQIIIDSLNNYQKQAQEQMMEQANQAVADEIEEIENDPRSPIYGNPDAEVVLVEFFDYLCGYCKRAFNDLKKIADKNKDIKIVFKEFPILGPNSTIASKAGLAVNKIAPEKYMAFHEAAMENRISGESSIEKIISELGLNWEKVQASMESAEVNIALQKNRDLANKLGIRGTPAFVIGGKLHRGAIGFDAMQEAIDNAR